MSDDAKKIILARRTRFVAAALASAAIACGKEAGTGGCARPCLEPPPMPEDAGPTPRVCLSAATPQDPPPQPCLSVPIPQDAGKKETK